MRLSAALVALLSVSAVSAQADVVGNARVIDGDTIVIDGEHVRLRGIDAPEKDQTCTAFGQHWPCGRTAAEWLKDYLRGCALRGPNRLALSEVLDLAEHFIRGGVEPIAEIAGAARLDQ